MQIVIWLLSLILIVNCLLLGLLILIQLPKKEAGMGTAFGGAATDALFGAGSGNALTKITKWSAGIFMGLCLIVSILTAQQSKARGRGIREALSRPDAAAVIPNNPAVALTNTAQLAPIPATNVTLPAPNVPVPNSPAPVTPDSPPKN